MSNPNEEQVMDKSMQVRILGNKGHRYERSKKLPTRNKKLITKNKGHRY